MKLYLHTTRYGIETTLLYHGDVALYNPDNASLVISGTVWDQEPELTPAFRYASMTVLAGLSTGDEFSIVRCDSVGENCHPDDKDPEKTVLVLTGN